MMSLPVMDRTPQTAPPPDSTTALYSTPDSTSPGQHHPQTAQPPWMAPHGQHHPQTEQPSQTAPPPSVQQAGGMYLTGMLSCLLFISGVIYLFLEPELSRAQQIPK